MAKTFLVTGSAGFIGFHLSKRLLEQGHRVVGFDNLNDYYSVELKQDRNDQLKGYSRYSFIQADVSEKSAVSDVFSRHEFDTVFHLAAQAGVRYSLENPEAYLKSNIDGTLTILEAARHSKTKPHLLIASSSSVYGLSQHYPFKEDDPADRPVALYGATKRADELMGHSYSHLFGLRVTMLRFFTVYGPWGRPDMALFKFVRAILGGEEIEVYNNGDMIRDFTYVSDIVDGIVGLAENRTKPEHPLYDVFNIGCAKPRTLMEFIRAIEKSVGKKAKMKMMPFQAGDVYKTYADVSKLREICGYTPKVGIEDGIENFVRWYVEYYKA
ncbi:MAG: SDR family NAD(P)-dependent oxidoreductase [Bdellovibrionota bacterium]